MAQKRKRSYSIVCTCVVCGKRFRASRTDAKYDSAACRKQASRGRGGQKRKTNLPDASQMSFAALEKLVQGLGLS